MFAYYVDHALRSFHNARGLTGLMVLTTAMGIGASMTTLQGLSADPLLACNQNLLRVQLDPASKDNFVPGLPFALTFAT
jgi:putative ABC transport system permease protein